jgi:hypothetical protein
MNPPIRVEVTTSSGSADPCGRIADAEDARDLPANVLWRCPADREPGRRDIARVLLCLPSVDPDVLAGDPAGGRLAEQPDHPGDVVWRAEAIQG